MSLNVFVALARPHAGIDDGIDPEQSSTFLTI